MRGGQRWIIRRCTMTGLVEKGSSGGGGWQAKAAKRADGCIYIQKGLGACAFSLAVGRRS